jgi:hypothetical protein
VLVTTEAAALPLHPLHFAPEMPAAVAQNAKERLSLASARVDSQRQFHRL